MHRRNLLQFLGAAMLSPLLAPLSAEERWRAGSRLHRSLRRGPAGADGLSPAQLTLVTALADTLIPRTDTPGAVDVDVPRFIDRLVAEWYSDTDRTGILAGLDAIDALARTTAGKSFAELDAAARATVLAALDRQSNPRDPAESAWRTVRDQIVFGYVTSQPIAELRRTTPIIPGRFDGCEPVGAPR